MVTAEQAGTYRQFTQRLRIQRGPGNPDLVSERPRDQKSRNYLDSDAKPTLITLSEGDLADVPALLASGAIAPHTPKSGRVRG